MRWYLCQREIGISSQCIFFSCWDVLSACRPPALKSREILVSYYYAFRLSWLYRYGDRSRSGVVSTKSTAWQKSRRQFYCVWNIRLKWTSFLSISIISLTYAKAKQNLRSRVQQCWYDTTMAKSERTALPACLQKMGIPLVTTDLVTIEVSLKEFSLSIPQGGDFPVLKVVLN